MRGWWGLTLLMLGGGEVVEFGMAGRMLEMLGVVAVSNVLMANAVDIDAGEEMNAGDT